MIPAVTIPRPAALRPELLQGRVLVEYYGESAMSRIGVCNWTYLLLVDQPGCGGAVVDIRHGLQQTLSFTAEDLALLRGKLAELQLPLHFEDRMTFDDGHGILRLPQGWDTHIDFHWRGQPAEAWRPLLGWMRVVHDLIPEKVWDDALRE